MDRHQLGLQKRARLNAMRHLLLTIPYDGRDLANIGVVDARLVSRPTLSSPAAFPVSVPVPAKKRKNGTT